MSTRGGLLSFGSPAASLRVRDVGGPARRRDSGPGSDVLLFMLIISASHPGSSDAGAGNPSPASWGRGNRAPGAWTALRLVTLILGRLPPPSVPPPAPGRPPHHPPVIRRRFKSPLGQGGIRMLSRRWRAKRAPPVDGGGLRAGRLRPRSGRLGWPGSPRGDRGSRRFHESRVHLWPRRTSSRCAVPPLPSGSKPRDAGRPNRPPPTPRGPRVLSVCPSCTGLGWFP